MICFISGKWIFGLILALYCVRFELLLQVKALINQIRSRF